MTDDTVTIKPKEKDASDMMYSVLSLLFAAIAVSDELIPPNVDAGGLTDAQSRMQNLLLMAQEKATQAIITLDA